MNTKQFRQIFGLSVASLLLTSQVAFGQQQMMSQAGDFDADDIDYTAEDPAAEAAEAAAFAAAEADALAKGTESLAPGDLVRMFTHQSTPANSSGHITYISDPLCDGNPNAMLVVTANYNYAPGQGGVYNNHPIGVWYTGSQWTIFNQDGATMPDGAAFNVRIGKATLHQANFANVTGNWTTLDLPLANNNPTAKVIATPNWGPNGEPGIYFNHKYGVWYTGSRWAIYNEDGAAMQNGLCFNVIVDTTAFIHDAGPANTSGHVTAIDNVRTNGKPNVQLIVTPNWNPNGSGGTYNNHNTAVWYNGSKWTVYNQDGAPMPNGASFNVIVADVPAISTVAVQGKKLVVQGENFPNGSVIIVNGLDRTTINVASAPTTKLISRKINSTIAHGATVSIQVRTADGLLSSPVSYTRP